MALVNQSKPTTTLANVTKVVNFETWDSITSTWASETRTWNDMVSNWDGFSKPSTSLLNVAKPA